MTLMRYVARAYLLAVCVVLAALVALVVAVTLVENAGILANQVAGGWTALGLACFGGIDYAYQVLPIACFIGLLAAGCGLAQSGELLAVQAIGWGRWRLYAPFLTVTLALAALGGICGETVMPYAIAKRGALQRDKIQHVDPLTQFYQARNPWFRRGTWLLYLPELDRSKLRFAHPVAYGIDAGRLVCSIEADALVHTDGGWWFENARRESFVGPAYDAFARLHVDLAVGPEDLADVTGNPRELSSVALRALIGRRARSGFDTTAHRIELHGRLAYPLASLALVFLALPWATRPERRRTLSATLSPGVVAVALYLATSQIFRLLGLAHKVSPAMGAFGAPGLVLAMAFVHAGWPLSRVRPSFLGAPGGRSLRR